MIAAAAVVSRLPHQPNEYVEQDSFTQEPFISGAPLSIPISCYSAAGPTPYFFSTQLEEEAVLAVIQANNRVLELFHFAGQPDRYDSYLILAGEPGREAYYGLIVLGPETLEEDGLNRYAATGLSMRVLDRAGDGGGLLFPFIALAKEELSSTPITLRETALLPDARFTDLLGDGGAISLHDLLLHVYQRSPWYDVDEDTQERITVSFAEDALPADEADLPQEALTGVYRGRFAVVFTGEWFRIELLPEAGAPAG